MIFAYSSDCTAEPGLRMSHEANSDFLHRRGGAAARGALRHSRSVRCARICDTAAAGPARMGGHVAVARSVDRDRGLHSLLPPAAAFAADAAVARRSAHRTPLRGRHRRERCAGLRQRAGRRRISSIRKNSRPLRGRAAARQLPRDQRGVRDRAGDVPRCHQFPDDRRRRDRLAGLAGADGCAPPRPPAPIWSAGRCCRISTTI